MKGFNAKCTSSIHGIRYEAVIYAKVNTTGYYESNVRTYKILNRDTGRAELVISSNMFNLCFERL
jgi:hypothetical protein